ncbi:hypothetical protein O0I10_000372 [Lichtheimia ornata]|uniref:Uncharacterized protein n=1 Tax=Lichtheimia ornata TaxID=688661 RepID=A0AAD8DIS9_9FUNG|nr:uncharacterized protein O0I10_000372 [Lichtheimia ornata]KAJ8664094.1 hypothetical protein O0I10_000372 [Lichtheimia ornata]
MRFTAISLATIACLVATAQAAPPPQLAPLALGKRVLGVDGNGVAGATSALGGCKNPAPAGPNGYPTVDPSVTSPKGVVQSLVESLYPGLSNTTGQVDELVADILSALGADKLAGGILGGALDAVNDLAQKLGLEVGCIVQIVKETVEKVLGADKAKALEAAGGDAASSSQQ